MGTLGGIACSPFSLRLLATKKMERRMNDAMAMALRSIWQLIWCEASEFGMLPSGGMILRIIRSTGTNDLTREASGS